jgi:hypothetical protein
MRKLLLAALLVLVLLAVFQTPSEAVIVNCPPDIRGCGVDCCFICYISTATVYPDLTYDCNYDDCTFFCSRQPM